MRCHHKFENDSIDKEALLALVKAVEPADLSYRIWAIKDCREIAELISKTTLNLPPVESVVMGRLPPHNKSVIHIDQVPGRTNHIVVINIPLTPSKLVRMNWFRPLKENALVPTPAAYGNRGTVTKILDEDAEQIDSVECDTPFFARTDVLHNVTNQSNELGYVMSLRVTDPVSITFSDPLADFLK
jgi:hypothetical protein